MPETDRYDIEATWRKNLTQAPVVSHVDGSEQMPGGPWRWCSLDVHSPLGIPAGPLLNGDWICHYAQLGFDILVYKTVRSTAHECYALPNLVPVRSSSLSAAGTTVDAADSPQSSWAVSFGMPSVAPETWRADVEQTRRRLPNGKLLIVSVVATQDASITNAQQSISQIAADFALTAKMAAESGAHGIEANFSCPNVATSDGQLYQQPESAALVAHAIRNVINKLPLVLKIGHTTDRTHIDHLVKCVAPYVDGLAMTNSIAARVRHPNGDLLFDGQSRGICGDAIRTASCAQVAEFADSISKHSASLHIVGVGGISNAKHAHEYLQAGAQTVGIATAAMQNPHIAQQIKAATSWRTWANDAN